MTVVTDVVARLRADTSDFNRGFAAASATVRNFEASAKSASTSVDKTAASISGASLQMQRMFGTSAGSAAYSATSIAASTASISQSFGHAGASAERMGDSVGRAAANTGEEFAAAGGSVAESAGGMDAALGNAAGGMLGSMKSMRGGMAGLMLAAGAAGAAVAAAFVMMTMKGVKAAAQYEQTTIAFTSSFEAMGRSAEDAQVYLKNLRDFAAKTPFTLVGLLDSVRGLIAVGNSPEKVIRSMLPAIGDMAAMMGVGEDAIAGVVYAMRQMTGAPRVLSQDLYQVQNALPGFNAKAALAKDAVLALSAGFKRGNMSGLTQAMEKGLISGKDAVDALIRGMEKFPGAAGMMKKQSETMNGVLSTFADEVNNALIDGFAPAIPYISKALLGLLPVAQMLTKGFATAMGPQLAAAINQIVPALTEMASKAGPMIGEFIGKILPLMAPLIEVFARFGLIAGGVVMAALNAVSPLLFSIMNGLNTIFSALTPVVGALINFGTALGGSTGSLQLMIQQVVLVVQILAPWIAIILQGAAVMMQFTNKILGVLTPILKFASGVEVMQAVVSKNMGAVIAVVKALAYAWGFSSSIIQQVVAGISKLMSPLVKKISDGMQAVKRAFQVAAVAISFAWNMFGRDIISGTLGWLGGIVSAVAGFGKEVFMAMWDLADKMTFGLLSGIKEGLAPIFDLLSITIADAVKTAGDQGTREALYQGYNIGQAFRQGIVDGAGEFSDVVKTRHGHGQAPKKPPAMPGTGLTNDMPGTGGGGGGGGGAASAGKAVEQQKKWYATIQELSKALKLFAADTTISLSEISKIVNRSRGIFAMFSTTFAKGSEYIRAAIKQMMKDGEVTAKEIAALAKKLRESLAEFNKNAKPQIDIVRANFAKFAALTMRAFDAQTQAQSNAIREQYQTGAGGSMVQSFASSTAAPTFAAHVDLGDTDFLNGLDSSIETMRAGLSSALGELFGPSGQVDMSLRGITRRFNEAVRLIQAARDTAVASADTARGAEYKAADAARTALTPAEQELKDMQEGAKQENLQRNKTSAEAAVAAAGKIRNAKARGIALLAAQQQLDEALKAIQMDALQAQAEIERKARDAEYTDRVSAADEKYNTAVAEADRLYQQAALAAQAEYEREAEANRLAEEEAVRNAEFLRENDRVLLEDTLNNLANMLSKKKVNWAAFQTEMTKLTNDPKFKTAFENSGANLGEAFAKGLGSAHGKIMTAVGKIAQMIKDYLELHSPAKIGPMSDLNTWWKAFDTTLMVGFDAKGLARSLNKAIASIPSNVNVAGIMKPGDGMVSIMPVSGGKDKSTQPIINITVNGSVIQERDLAETIRAELIKIGRRDGSIFGGIV